MARVLVIGSINMDLVVQADRFPAPGETLLGRNFCTCPGGKGANQAVAARRLGADVRLIGCLGKDAFGTELLANLNQENIDTRHIRFTDLAATGIASIAVCRAENSIIVAPGANHELAPVDIYAAESSFAWADVILTQLEVPLETVEAAAILARQHNKPFLLNPAPAMPLAPQLLKNITLLIPNEHELATVLSARPADWQQHLRHHPEKIVMTKGADGAWFTDRAGELHHQAGFAVTAVDTTGAGDTFNGALAAFWGESLATSVKMACAAGALSVTQPGAQGGMPTLEQLNLFLATAQPAVPDTAIRDLAPDRTSP